jgi:transcriptional regulator with XRE-family HTH domain
MRLLSLGGRPCEGAVRGYDDLVIAIRAVKEFLGLSNETLEEIAGLTRGHIDKLLRPSREKKIGPQVLPLILGALGIRLRVEIDPEQSKRVARKVPGSRSVSGPGYSGIPACRRASSYLARSSGR